MNEHSFIRAIHKKIHPDVHAWKIHDTYAGGVPDCMYSGKSGVLFVEYKYIKELPKRQTTNIRHSLSALQNAWLNRMQQSAHAALIIGVGKDSGIIIVDDFSAIISTMRYLEDSVTFKDIASWIYNITVQGCAANEQTIITPNRSSKPAKNMGYKTA